MTLKYQEVRKFNCFRYFRHGLKHRIDGPATVWVDGDTVWWEFGELHRMDGPADKIGGEFYYIRGKRYTKDQYDAKIRS